MYPPNYDLRGVQIVHEQHLKELRQEAAAYHFAEELKRDAAADGEMPKPSWIARGVQHLVARLRILIYAPSAKPSATQGRRKGFNSG
jgi:hypothetical protein